MAPSVRAKKLFLGVRDDSNFDRRQLSILTTLTDGNELFSNQYAKSFTQDEIGNFDVTKNGDKAFLEFSPIDLRTNKYSYSFISYDTKQTIFSSDSFDLGNTVSVATTNIVSAASTTVPGITTVFTIPPNVTSGKLLLETSSQEDDNYEFNEINFVSTDSDVYFIEYGKLTISDSRPSGIGTYGITSTGDVTFTPNLLDEFRTNVISVSIANTSFTSVASQNLRHGNVESIRVSIAATDNPQPVTVSQFTSTFNSGYYIIQMVGFNTVTQTTSTQLTEITTLNNDVEAAIVQYGSVNVDQDLGTFDVNSAGIVDLFFTPVENTNIEMTIAQHTVSYADFAPFPASVNFNNAELTTGVTIFSQSSDITLKKDFDLKHDDIPIFERRFNGSLSSEDNTGGIDFENNFIYLPSHYFVTGEEVTYRSQGAQYVALTDTLVSTTAPIGSTTINLDSTFSIKGGDFLETDTSGKLSIVGVGSTSVSLGSSLAIQINAGTAATIFRLNQGVDDLTNTINSIGIAQTFIAGVGNTDKLSGQLYVFKKDELFIGFGTSPIDVISQPPKLIDLTSVGVGNNHYITSKNQNSKCLIAIDNMIQSPIVSTSTTSLLTSNLELVETTVYVDTIQNFASGDIIKINDEIMKITSVGVGTTSLEFQVERPFMGTFLKDHTSGSIITKFDGNYNIVGSKIYFAEAPYGPIFDPINGDVNIRSTFQGRSFMRSATPGENERTYQENYVFDDLQDEFNSIEKDFTLTSNNQSISGFSTSNSISLINGIFQNPKEDYNLDEVSGDTEIQFTGTATSALYDPNNASVPRGGIPVSIGSSNGFGYQPLISAGGTAVVSSGGTIQSISIGYSGSGYREGIQTIVNVGVQTASTGVPNIEFIGTATVSNGSIVSVNITNPGSGYTTSNPPEVVFDEPFSYENLDLIYQSPSSGLGTEAKIDIVVGQGSSVIDFTIRNYGYSFEVGDILTVESGGTTGIPTVSSASFEPFSIIIEDIRNDKFSGWTVGELERLDDLDDLIDGFEKTFPISKDQNRFAILSREGSLIELSAVLLIFINDVLQEPNVAYTFEGGGSLIRFTEAPPIGAKCRMYFYKGTPNIDVVDVDLLETVQVGDTLKIVGDNLALTQEKRLVKDVFLADAVKTNNYNAVGVSSNNELLRPVTWCKQRNDTIVDGIPISKSRNSYEPYIYPIANIIQSVGVGATQIFVDNIITIFDQNNENVTDRYRNNIEILDTFKETIGATATATVNNQGEVDSVQIVNGGKGYESVPEVSLAYPQTGIVTSRATATSSISNGQVNTITVTSGGIGYNSANPPIVIIDPPTPTNEVLNQVAFSGDFGFITGVKVGTSSTELIFDLYIPEDSFLRDTTFTDPIIEQSGILEGYYFNVTNSQTGDPVNSRRLDGNTIGIGTTGLNNVYQVASVSTASTDAYGVGNVNLTQVLVYVDDNSGVSVGSSSYFGDFSWGLINLLTSTLNEYNVNEFNGVVGLNTTPTVRRLNPLRYDNYL